MEQAISECAAKIQSNEHIGNFDSANTMLDAVEQFTTTHKTMLHPVTKVNITGTCDLLNNGTMVDVVEVFVAVQYTKALNCANNDSHVSKYTTRTDAVMRF
jgi:hypothetical protein